MSQRIGKCKTLGLMVAAVVTLLALSATTVHASEADLAIPDLHEGRFFNHGDPNAGISGWNLLLIGSFVICGTLGISLYLRAQIKALPALQHIPVVFVSAMGQEQEIARGQDAGATDYLLKPFVPEALIQKIHTILADQP